jgi:hypothetical protein
MTAAAGRGFMKGEASRYLKTYLPGQSAQEMRGGTIQGAVLPVSDGTIKSLV